MSCPITFGRKPASLPHWLAAHLVSIRLSNRLPNMMSPATWAWARQKATNCGVRSCTRSSRSSPSRSYSDLRQAGWSALQRAANAPLQPLQHRLPPQLLPTVNREVFSRPQKAHGSCLTHTHTSCMPHTASYLIPHGPKRPLAGPMIMESYGASLGLPSGPSWAFCGRSQHLLARPRLR